MRDSDNRGALSALIAIIIAVLSFNNSKVAPIVIVSNDPLNRAKSEPRVADASEKLPAIDSLTSSQDAQQTKVSGLIQHQVFRYRVTEVFELNPGLEWLLEPPLSETLSAVQILFWSGDGHIKITSAGHGSPIGARQQFAFPQTLEGMVFGLRIYHVDDNTIIKLVFPEQEALYPGAELLIPGTRSISGPSSEYRLTIEPST